MIAQNEIGRVHELPENVRPISSRQGIGNRLTKDRLRISADSSRFPIHPHHEMTVTSAWIELDGLGAELLIDRLDQFASVFRLDQARPSHRPS